MGSDKVIHLDLRVIATTNRNLMEEVAEGRFREDLYYRLNVFPLNTSAVANRGDDIVAIATFLLKRHAVTTANIPWLKDSAVSKLRSYNWPGNVRELENVLQRALVLSMDGNITESEIITDDRLHLMSGPKSQMTMPMPTTQSAMAAHS